MQFFGADVSTAKDQFQASFYADLNAMESHREIAAKITDMLSKAI